MCVSSDTPRCSHGGQRTSEKVSLSFHFVVLRYQTQVIRLVCKALGQLSRLTGHSFFFKGNYIEMKETCSVTNSYDTDLKCPQESYAEMDWSM